MKTVFKLLKAALGWQILLWFGIFVLFLAGSAQFQPPINIENPYAETIIQMISILISILFTGYLFNVAVRMANGQEKPLKPLAFANSFEMGVRVILRMVIISIPMIAVSTYAFILQGEEALNFASTYSMFYLIFMLAPYAFFLVKKAPQMPWMNGLWSYFKKNASSVFAFIFWSALIYVAWLYLLQYSLSLANLYATSVWSLTGFIFVPFIVLFYTIFLNAILLGFFARQTTLTMAAAAPVAEETKVVETPKKVATKKMPVGIVIKTETMKKTNTSAKKTVAKKPVAQKAASKKKAATHK